MNFFILKLLTLTVTTTLSILKFYLLHTVYLCVLCGSQYKQRLLPYTALTDWFLKPRRIVFTALYGLGL
jgi:hypothetical protein